MRHIVPPSVLLLLSALLAGPGCSGSHGREGETDAGVRTDAAPAPGDSGTHEDDAGGCFRSEVSAQILCTGERYGPVRIYDDVGCFCGQELVCDTRIDTESGGIIGYAEVETIAEACGAICGACEPIEGSCDVPAELYDGSFAVNVAGWVLPTTTNSLTPDTCWNPPPAPGSGTVCPDPASGGYPVDGSDLCVPEDAQIGYPVTVSVQAAVGCDTHSAGCRAVRTDDGFDIVPLARDCECATCGACPPEPMPRTFTCRLPPLEAGSYTIRHGDASATLTVSATGTGNELCGD